MTNLSHSAQAVIDAYCTEADRLDREVSHEEMLAAALRTAADQTENVHPVRPSTEWGEGWLEGVQDVVAGFRRIADELEGVGDGKTIQNPSTQEQISEEENERRFKECMKWLNNLKPGEIREMMGPEFMEEFRRVSQ